LTEKIICPNCNRGSNVADQLAIVSCPFCDFVFNWRQPDRRIFERTRKEMSATLELNSTLLTVKIKDISERGAGIIIESTPFVNKGDTVKYKSREDVGIKDATVVWTFHNKEKQRVGLLFF
jgi:hypothetical protein